jgi:peptidoglycan LD-endopeptidase CwlK
MPSFSQNSLDHLSTCVQPLQDLFNEVIKYFDCTIVCGYRNQQDQDQAFADGLTKLKWPNGKHNTQPSKAVDVAPCINGKINWSLNQCILFAGIVLGFASQKGIKIRWGGDWNSNLDLSDNTFNDYDHFELVD